MSGSIRVLLHTTCEYICTLCKLCESSDGLSLRYVCSHHAGLEVEVGHPRRRLGIRGSAHALGHSSRWLGRACARACVRGSSPPTPQPDEDAFFQEGRSVERDVLKDPPESAFAPGSGQHCVGIGLGRPYEGSLEMPVPVDPDSDSLASDQSQSQLQWAILYSYRWQCDQCWLAVVGPGLRFTVMSFLSFGVKETGVCCWCYK